MVIMVLTNQAYGSDIMHPDIEKTINLIDHKIIELQKAKRTLLEAFGEGGIGTDRIQPPIPRLLKRRPLTRKEVVINLLGSEGPLSRSEILEKTHIPLGTVATILNDKTIFENKEGKWHLVEKEDQKEKDLTDSE
jgi:hypothetical protein